VDLECLIEPAEHELMTTGLLHHVELYVSDLERSLQFWSWFLGPLGCELAGEWEQGQSWKLGETYLVFVQAEERFQDPQYHRCRVGLNHLAFHARSRDHVDEVTDQLKSRGVKVLYQDKHPYAGGPDYYAVFFEDPDRIKIELVAPCE
jgi:catechol 2,3-dioxygenase-like lactoylglutathione lyase family enzyme